MSRSGKSGFRFSAFRIAPIQTVKLDGADWRLIHRSRNLARHRLAAIICRAFAAAINTKSS